MQSRRSLRLVAGALVLALPVLGSCGFDKATDRVYTQAVGINNRDGDVHVLSAVIVSAQEGSGTFIASLSNTQPEENALTGLAGAGEWTDLTFAPEDPSVDIVARGFVNLVDEDPITVTGDFTPGQVVELTLSFDNGDAVTMDAPVVYACNEYEGLDGSASEPGESPADVPTDDTSAGSTESPTETESASAAASAPAEPYDCLAVGED